MKQQILLGMLTFLFSFSLQAQQREVTGRVIDREFREGIPGVTVSVRGTSRGIVTDIEGNYSLPASAEEYLVFSFVGYNTVTELVGNRSIINVTLEDDISDLEAVVVVGYGTQRKADITGAIVAVDLGPIRGQTMSSGNPMQALQGRVPGLLIEKSGDPSGASSRVLIRGVSTLGNNDPLYVIDGVPTKRPEVFASLNPEAIESIQVLKDASAASIYGSRAANGVIVVTTKRRAGGGETLSVTLNSNFSVQDERRQRYQMLNSRQRGEALWRAMVNDGADPQSGYGEIYDFDWNNDFANPVLNNVSVRPFVGGNLDVPAGDTDWQDVLYETGYVFNNELTVATNTEKSSLMINLGHLKNTGILKYTGFERYSARINANTYLFDDKLRFGVNAQFTNSNETPMARDVGGAPTPGLAITLAPTIPVRDINGDFAGPLGAGYSDRNNPLLMQYLGRWNNIRKNNFYGNVFAEWSILENLTFKTSAGIDYNTFFNRNIQTRVRNGFITRPNNRLIHDTNEFSSMVFSNTLNYQVAVGKSRISVLGGVEAIRDDFSRMMAMAEGFAVETDSYFVMDAATGSRTNTGTTTGNRLLSQFGKVDYAYSDKYLASVTIRRDGSSRFGRNTRYGVFPAATVGWRLSEEEFIKQITPISDLKFRAGYGVVGNQEIGDLARFGLYEARYGPNQSQFVGGFFEFYYNVGTAYDIAGNGTGTLPSGFVSIQAENPNLKWETTKEINLGLDFSLFDFAITGSFDYFRRSTTDILTRPPIASVIGEGQQRVLNGASTEANGWELLLSYQKRFANGVNMTVNTNFGAFRDRITFLPEEVRAAFPGTAQNSIIGQSQFSIFGFRTDGLFQSEEEIASSPFQVGARPGGIKFVDLNGDGVIDADDRDFIGNTLPALEYGIGINLNYRNFDFAIFGSGVAGRIGLDPYIFWNNFVQGRENAGLGVLNAWSPENPTSDIPSLSLAFNDTQTSDYLFRNNSYFKIRNLQLGYTLPESLIQRAKAIGNVRVYLQGENLFWITPKNYIGSDPERTDVNRIPVPSVYSMGLNVNF